MPSSVEPLQSAETDKRNRLKAEKPLVYEKVLAFKDKVARGQSIAIIQFQYDYTCNFACQHCSVKRFQGPKNQRSLTIADVRSIADQADALGLAHWVITGGEPLVFADFDELVAAVGPQRFYITSDTNGWLLDEARAARAKGVIPFVLMAEGADGLVGAPPERLAELRRRGLLVVGITGPQGNAFADSGASPRSEGGGLTEKGAGLVASCRDDGVLVDLTHASPAAFWDVIVEQGSLAAVTHTAARALREHSRNLDDLQIIALSRSGGVMGLVFNPELIKPEQPETGVADLMDHVAHVRRLGALDALALGTDYGGIRPPGGLEDVSTLPRVTEALLAAGLSRDEVLGVLGGNAAALLEAVEARQGAAEAGREEPLRPIMVECEAVIGESEGAALRACDGYVVAPGPTLGPATRQRLRLVEVARTPVKVEIFGEAGTPWQVEAQDLGGKVLMRRVVALDRDGVGSLPLPSERGLVRVFLSPTRRSVLREAVVWGR